MSAPSDIVSSRVVAIAGAAVVVSLIALRGGKKSKKSHQGSETKRAPVVICAGECNLLRRARIAFGGPSDHVGDVVVAASDAFDLDRTIFASVDSKLTRMMLRDKLSVEIFWSEAAVASITTTFARVPPAPPHDDSLIAFMRDECDFSTEHADGSFMDHLQFCYE